MRLRDPRWYLWIGAGTIAVYFSFMVGFLLVDQAIPAILLYFVPLTQGAVYLGPAIAMTHALVKVRMRALASSILLFILAAKYVKEDLKAKDRLAGGAEA